MAPTICSEKKTQQRSGINEIRKESKFTNLSKAPSSSLNYAQIQKRSKSSRPFLSRGKRQVENSVYQISSSSDTSNDTKERFHHIESPPPSSISDHFISTSSDSSVPSSLTLSSCPLNYHSFEDNEPGASRLKPFNHHNIDLSSVCTISSTDEEQNLDEDMISRSFNVIATDNPDNVSSTIEDDKTSFKNQLKKLEMQQETKHTKGLFEIAIKMIKLVHRNQLLQRRLSQLQTETSEFIQSVLANPENQAFRDKVQANGCCKN